MLRPRSGGTGGAGRDRRCTRLVERPGCAGRTGTVVSCIGPLVRSYVCIVLVMAHARQASGLGDPPKLQCDGAVETGTCQTRAYDDAYDVMGISWGQVAR